MAYSSDGLTMAWYAQVLTNSEELWILRLTNPSALFALEVTVLVEQHFSVALKMQTCSVHARLRTYYIASI